MARAGRRRNLPSTPPARADRPADTHGSSPAELPAQLPAEPSPRVVAPAAPDPTDAVEQAPRQPSRWRRRLAARQARPTPAYLLRGTGCVAGHTPGHELDAGPIGPVPSEGRTWVGVAMILWCWAGLYFLADPRWFDLAAFVTVLWLAFSAFVQRRRGHRGRCWRTRAWRHAWGGLVPSRD